MSLLRPRACNRNWRDRYLHPGGGIEDFPDGWKLHSRIVVAHNHPSGRLEPSPEDLEITRRLREAGETLGIPLLDHVIFCPEGYWSFVEHGLLDPQEEGG